MDFLNLLGLGETVVTTAKRGEEEGFWNINKLLGLQPAVTPSANDPEYIQNVKQEMQRERSETENAINSLDKTRSDAKTYAQRIVDLYNNETSKWGDPNAPNRNVADPQGFYQSLRGIIAEYQNANNWDRINPVNEQYDPKKQTLPNANNQNDTTQNNRSDENYPGNNMSGYINSGIIMIVAFLIIGVVIITGLNK